MAVTRYINEVSFFFVKLSSDSFFIFDFGYKIITNSEFNSETNSEFNLKKNNFLERMS